MRPGKSDGLGVSTVFHDNAQQDHQLTGLRAPNYALTVEWAAQAGAHSDELGGVN